MFFKTYQKDSVSVTEKKKEKGFNVFQQQSQGYIRDRHKENKDKSILSGIDFIIFGMQKEHSKH